jgi:hypothetical protein
MKCVKYRSLWWKLLICLSELMFEQTQPIRKAPWGGGLAAAGCGNHPREWPPIVIRDASSRKIDATRADTGMGLVAEYARMT